MNRRTSPLLMTTTVALAATVLGIRVALVVTIEAVEAVEAVIGVGVGAEGGVEAVTEGGEAEAVIEGAEAVIGTEAVVEGRREGVGGAHRADLERSLKSLSGIWPSRWMRAS